MPTASVGMAPNEVFHHDIDHLTLNNPLVQPGANGDGGPVLAEGPLRRHVAVGSPTYFFPDGSLIVLPSTEKTPLPR
jgi:hypothetical protein